jgi:methylaspartate mutase S subunit
MISGRSAKAAYWVSKKGTRGIPAVSKEWKVITGTVGMDAHVIGTKILSRVLRESGFNVIELGCLTPPDDFIKVAQETAADAILMSSLYGMAEFDLEGFKQKLLEAGLGNIVLYIGGNLASSRRDFDNFENLEMKFRALGFDRVYPPNIDLSQVIIDLKNDLIQRRKIA